MNDIYLYLTLSGVLTLLLWTPYIIARLFSWGLGTFLNNYPENFPNELPEQALWAARAQRTHLNMVETMPAFVAVVIGTTQLNISNLEVLITITSWVTIFFWARLAHAVVYITGIPYLRTPVYLVSWASILMIASTLL